ncbi:hypothetical protein [Deinococcus hopiensis]|uniref:Uncharacterized protein n=1 Tax=Deinococcus hopiensis KR-140 TaxID=695939 RepID=A0A1W1UXY1_9DEIO|nr:hypothetical protein [Deinococcus hopiensis]SMB85977.1 hypothetical protein SAMN00790413_03628 [Deinococcus hopiensis KR-140]
MRQPRVPLPLLLASLLLGSAGAAQPKAQQLATFKVASLAHASVSDVAFRAANLQPETVTIAGI